MNSAFKTIRKMAVAIVGFSVVATGVILLVLPGPGLLLIAVGLGILSLEFEWAEKRLHMLRRKIKETVKKANRR